MYYAPARHGAAFLAIIVLLLPCTLLPSSSSTLVNAASASAPPVKNLAHLLQAVKNQFTTAITAFVRSSRSANGGESKFDLTAHVQSACDAFLTHFRPDTSARKRNAAAAASEKSAQTKDRRDSDTSTGAAAAHGNDNTNDETKGTGNGADAHDKDDFEFGLGEQPIIGKVKARFSYIKIHSAVLPKGLKGFIKLGPSMTSVPRNGNTPFPHPRDITISGIKLDIELARTGLQTDLFGSVTGSIRILAEDIHLAVDMSAGLKHSPKVKVLFVEPIEVSFKTDSFFTGATINQALRAFQTKILSAAQDAISRFIQKEWGVAWINEIMSFYNLF